MICTFATGVCDTMERTLSITPRLTLKKLTTVVLTAVLLLLFLMTNNPVYDDDWHFDTVGSAECNDLECRVEAFEVGTIQALGVLQTERALVEHRLPDVIKPRVKKILIVAGWRTGSTFLGELIRSSPGVFYSYEPLLYTEHYPSAGSQMQLVRSLFDCKFDGDYLRYVNNLTSEATEFFSRNVRIWNACQDDRSLCYNSDFVQNLCPYFPVHLMKVVRLRLKEIKTIDEGWKVIYLVRDPRGIMASRSGMFWCQPGTVCDDVGGLCRNMTEDLSYYNELQARFPDQIYLQQFEDMSRNPKEAAAKLFKFLELPMTFPVKSFINVHTQQHDADPFSTFKNSKAIADKWRSTLASERIAHITEKCDKVLTALNYR